MRLLLTYTIILFAAFAALGAEIVPDEVNVNFRVGSKQFDPMFGDNHEAMARFEALLKNAIADDSVERVVVKAFASPDGSNKFNVRLAEERCQTIVNLIVKRTGLNRSLIESEPGGVAWTELRNMVASNPEVPEREKVLEVLDNTPVWVFNKRGEIVDGRKRQLMRVGRGEPYRWLLQHIFPKLRNSVAVVLYKKELNEEPVVVETDTVVAQQVDTVAVPVQLPPAENDDVVISPRSSEPLHRFALKNNIIYDAALIPNLEFEWLINNRWSVSIEGDVAWWSNLPANKKYRIAVVSPEVRYWVISKNAWHGLYTGVFAGGGAYDFENGGDGYKGHGYMAGVSAGYMWPISRCFSLEAELGVGYMNSKYEMYEPRDGHFPYLRTKSLNYIGPLKLKFSIVWRFSDKNKKNTKYESVK